MNINDKHKAKKNQTDTQMIKRKESKYITINNQFWKKKETIKQI